MSDSDTKVGTGRHDEIEITDAMLEAGGLTVARWGGMIDEPEALAQAVFESMDAVRRKSLEFRTLASGSGLVSRHTFS